MLPLVVFVPTDGDSRCRCVRGACLGVFGLVDPDAYRIVRLLCACHVVCLSLWPLAFKKNTYIHVVFHTHDKQTLSMGVSVVHEWRFWKHFYLAFV